MKVKKLFLPKELSNFCVLKTVNGEYKMFYYAPFRNLTEKDLRPAPGYFEKGRQAEEAAEWAYKMYGLEKEAKQ